MKKFVFAASVAGLGCVAAAQSPAELVKQVREVDLRFMQSLGNGDHKALDEILDKNAVVVTSTGKVGPRDHMIDAVRTGLTKVTRTAIEHEAVYMHGNTAVVSERMHSLGIARGHKMDNWLQILRVYMREDGQWHLISYQSTRILPSK